MDVPTDPDTVKFLSLLQCRGLENHVFIPTHESGHALDLFITRKGCDFSLGDLLLTAIYQIIHLLHVIYQYQSLIWRSGMSHMSRTRSFQIRFCPFIGTVVCHVTVVCSVGPFICYPSVKIAQAHGFVDKHQLYAVS